MKKLYCGGSFPFDYQNAGYEEQVSQDYRARILGSAELLLSRSSGVLLGETLLYIGPFYFEAPEMVDADIVRAEQQMVADCTHAVFLLDDGCCPGTITELVYAALLKKDMAVFYIRRPEDEETESPLHSPCWYPINFCMLQNPGMKLFSCKTAEDAARKILAYVQTL